MGPENNVPLGGCRILGGLLAYVNMLTVPHNMVGLERMLDYRGVGIVRFTVHLPTFLPFAAHLSSITEDV